EKEDSLPLPLYRPSLASPSSPITISAEDSAGHNHLHHPSCCSFLVCPTRKITPSPTKKRAASPHRSPPAAFTPPAGTTNASRTPPSPAALAVADHRR
ncbi:hypothetical protein Dimus_000959, partial [Dionaea muscipula]